MRTFAQQVLSHERGAKGATFSEFEERLARLSTFITSGNGAAVSQGE